MPVEFRSFFLFCECSCILSRSDPDSAGVAVRSKPLWQDETVLNLEPDTGLLVTHVNQTQDLLVMLYNTTPSLQCREVKYPMHRKRHSLGSQSLTATYRNN